MEHIQSTLFQLNPKAHGERETYEGIEEETFNALMIELADQLYKIYPGPIVIWKAMGGT